MTAYIAVWFVSTLLLFAAMTDLFTQTPFQGKYLMIWFLLIASSFAVVRVLIAYRRRKKQMAN